MGGEIVAQRFEEMKKGQAERLFPMLEAVLGDVGAVWEELDAIGVGTGPGNFTGIRITVSAARGLALSLGVPAVGVSGFEAVRRMVGADGRKCLAALPAPRDQWLVEITDTGGRDGFRGLIAGSHLSSHGHVVPPAVIGPWSDGMEVESSTVIEGRRVPDVSDAANLPDFNVRLAPCIAELAAENLGETAEIPSPSPVYVRPPDAAPTSDPPPVILP
jgi:tRNA threonylcarbamoyl adenosine modification protein YeaZ